MRIVCPHCQAAYQVDTLIKGAVLVCHRCNNEFGLEIQPKATPLEHASSKNTPLPLFVTHKMIEEPAPVEEEDEVIIPLTEIQDETDMEEPIIASSAENIDEHMFPPTRKNNSIKPWLILILFLIGLVGVWQKQEIWLNHTWTRSMMVSLLLPIKITASDWRIQQASSEWIKRDDGSRALLIEGRIENLLYANMVPPAIQIQLFKHPSDMSPVWQETRFITVPPSLDQLKTTPFKVPKQDRILIKSKGHRSFIFLIEPIPKRPMHFVLNPASIN